ncbi:MAG: hemerythrin domain-containing protein [Acidobacteriota bacterium]
MDPIETLMHEHKVILTFCDATVREAERLRSGGALHTERVERMLDFIRNFADRCHHLKEEDHLFARMAERGFPVQTGPVAMMLHEHELGRSHVRAVAEALPRAAAADGAALAAVADHLTAWAELLRAHIYKEDNILYPMARQALSAQDMAELEVSFEKVEREEMGEGVHERYHRFVHDLAAR